LDSKYNIINSKKVFLDMQNCVGKIDFMFSQEFQNSCRLTKLWNLTKVTIGMGGYILPYYIFIGE
jgi:hypothetical protein